MKLDKTENGVKRSKNFTQFTASMVAKGLIYVINQSNKNAEKLNFTIGEMWNGFDEVLDAVAESKWTAQSTNITIHAQNKSCFTTELNNLIERYAEKKNPKDILIEYLKGSN